MILLESTIIKIDTFLNNQQELQKTRKIFISVFNEIKLVFFVPNSKINNLMVT